MPLGAQGRPGEQRRASWGPPAQVADVVQEHAGEAVEALQLTALPQVELGRGQPLG